MQHVKMRINPTHETLDILRTMVEGRTVRAPERLEAT
jgi:hypothetical protein